MAADLERLLSHQEEIAMMKQLLISMRPNQGEAQNLLGTDKTAARGSGPGKRHPRRLSRTTKEELPSVPKPTVFTNKEAPHWHQKLRQKPK